MAKLGGYGVAKAIGPRRVARGVSRKKRDFTTNASVLSRAADPFLKPFKKQLITGRQKGKPYVRLSGYEKG